MPEKFWRFYCVLQVIVQLAGVIISAATAHMTDPAACIYTGNCKSVLSFFIYKQLYFHITCPSVNVDNSATGSHVSKLHLLVTDQTQVLFENYLLRAETKTASRLAFIEATVVSKNRRPACSAVPRLSSLKPVWIGATTTLMFSSPVLPGGPKADSGSDTAFLDLSRVEKHIATR